MDENRAPGWYPDPWGSDTNRYFDGSAWARDTRRDGSDDGHPVAPGAPPAAPAAPTAAPAAPTATPEEPPPTAAESVAAPADGAPPGWHRDPWGLAGLRWWDGTTWTGHVSGPPATRPVDVAAERSLARWVRPALLGGGIAQAIGLVASVPQAQWVVEHWDAITQPGGRPVPQMPQSTATDLSQLAFLIGIVVGVLFLLWFYRAASTGWASGLPARRGPAMATLSFIIPIVNLWWPYQATLDMVPATDSRRTVIRWWWVLWLTGTLCGLLIYPTAAVSNETAARAVAAVGAAAMLGAALAARAMVEYVTSTHEHLAGSAASA